MKLKYIAVVFTIIILGIMFGSTILLADKSLDQVDVTKLNDQYQNVCEDLNQKQNISDIEEQFQCKIFSNKAADYEKLVMNAIRDNYILMDYNITQNDGEMIAGKIQFNSFHTDYEALKDQLRNKVLLLMIIVLFTGYILLFYIYLSYVRPFHKLKLFASNVAQGDLDAPLQINRNNYFGVFTESFDLMREELKKAKKNEYEANKRKKELVAELSHDMKTPLATIKATCEVLQTKMSLQKEDNHNVNPELALEDYSGKIGLIQHKTDTIDQLIGNMFHATLEELEVLKVEAVIQPSTKIKEMMNDIPQLEKVTVINQIPECLVYMDVLRLKQVIDNIINNSFKYAKTEIQISYSEEADGIMIELRDFGTGVNDEEIPMLTKKFYRGKNASGEDGSGLGLYLAQYFMSHMNGEFECFNDHGFVAHLFLKKA